MFQRLKTFFVAIGKSCYDMEFYRGIRTAPFGRAARYAIGLHLALVAVMTSVLLPLAIGARGRLYDHLNDRLPEHAEIRMENGRLSSTLPAPYEFGGDGFQFVLDPTHEGLSFPEALKGEGALFGRDAAFARGSGAKLETYPYKEVDDFAVSKRQALGWLGGIGASTVLALLVPVMLLYGALFLGWTFLTVAVYSFFAWAFAGIWKVRMPYSRWYAVGLHAITLPLLVSGLLAAVGAHIPYASVVLFFLITASVLVDERNQPATGAR